MSGLDRVCQRLDRGLPQRIPFRTYAEREAIRQYAYRWARREGLVVRTRSRRQPTGRGTVFVYAGRAPAPEYTPTALSMVPSDIVRDVIAAGQIASDELEKAYLEQGVSA